MTPARARHVLPPRTTEAPGDPVIDTSSVRHNHVAIIGTGFGGIATAVRPGQAGFDDVVLLERAGHVGGVWRDNDDPGAAVDVQSHLCSFPRLGTRKPAGRQALGRAGAGRPVDRRGDLDGGNRWAAAQSTGTASAPDTPITDQFVGDLRATGRRNRVAASRAMIAASLNGNRGDPLEQDRPAATGFVVSRRRG